MSRYMHLHCLLQKKWCSSTKWDVILLPFDLAKETRCFIRRNSVYSVCSTKFISVTVGNSDHVFLSVKGTSPRFSGSFWHISVTAMSAMIICVVGRRVGSISSKQYSSSLRWCPYFSALGGTNWRWRIFLTTDPSVCQNGYICQLFCSLRLIDLNFTLWSSGLWHRIVLYTDTSISNEHTAYMKTGSITPTRLHGVVTQKTIIWMFTAVKTWKILDLKLTVLNYYLCKTSLMMCHHQRVMCSVT
jgi:hypothetical protein